MSDLRAKFLKSNVFRSKLIDVSVPQAEGPDVVLTVRVKQPSVEERNAIFADARVTQKNGETSATNGNRTGVLAIINCCRDPETDLPVFTAADIDSLMHTPAGGWVDKLAGEIMSLLADATEAAKK